MSRRYLDGSMVLETRFTTAEGVVAPHRPDAARTAGRTSYAAGGVCGTVRMRHEWRVRLDYGAIVPWVRRQIVDGEAVITAIAGPRPPGPARPATDGRSTTDMSTSSTPPRGRR